jgi:2-dehydropantoate 2-reductase
LGQSSAYNEEIVLKICILGAGALGCAIGGALTDGGHEVWLVNRDPAFLAALRQNGLIRRIDGVDSARPVRATPDCSEIAATSGSVDLIFVLVKSFHTREAIASAAPIIGEHTVVMSLQNGLGHEEVLADVVGRAKVIAGKTYTGGVVLAPGHIIAGTAGKETLIGELDGIMTERVQRIAVAMNQAGLITTVSQHIMGVMWEKLLVNVATGALSGITRLPYGELYQVAEVEACAIAAVAETMGVAKASGIPMETTDPRAPWVKAAAGLPYEFKASMLQSLEAGSITEIDYVNGAVVRQGAKVGVPTPVNQALVACLKGIERGLFGPTKA